MTRLKLNIYILFIFSSSDTGPPLGRKAATSCKPRDFCKVSRKIYHFCQQHLFIPMMTLRPGWWAAVWESELPSRSWGSDSLPGREADINSVASLTRGGCSESWTPLFALQESRGMSHRLLWSCCAFKIDKDYFKRGKSWIGEAKNVLLGREQLWLLGAKLSTPPKEGWIR